MKPAALLALPLILAACGTPAPRDAAAPLAPSAANLDVARASGFAPPPGCERGAMRDGRTMVLCKGAPPSLPQFRTALRGPVAEGVTVASVSRDYGIPASRLTGIAAATYSDITPKRAAAPGAQAATPYDTVVVEGRSYDVFRVGLGGRNGTIFVEKR